MKKTEKKLVNTRLRKVKKIGSNFDLVERGNNNVYKPKYKTKCAVCKSYKILEKNNQKVCKECKDKYYGR